ncbi:TPA: hypothetical protein JZG45_003963 [Escherichia coli]|nr:hypothetical protein [Escherichia coli]
MRNFIDSIIFLIVGLIAGFLAGQAYERQQNDKAASDAMLQSMNNAAENISVLTASIDTQRERESNYAKDIQSDTTRTDELLNRVMQHFDRVHESALPASKDHEAAAPTDTCVSERAKTRRLSGQLRSTLEQYGSEARRADENTRLLNECINQLVTDRNVWNQYHF